MKKIVLILFFALSLWANEASEAAKELGYSNSYVQGIEKAKKEHKIMLLVVVRDGCRWCKKFEKETLNDPKIRTKLDSFIKVLIDKDDAMPERFYTNFIPTVYFVDPKTEKSILGFMGFKESADFIHDIDAVRAK